MKKMTEKASKRIQSSEAKEKNGKVNKKSFTARAMKATSKNS